VRRPGPIRVASRRPRASASLNGCTLALALLAAAALAAPAVFAEPNDLAVAVVEGEDTPAYLAVHAAAALGTFEAEGVQVTLRRVKHPSGAVNALRDGTAAVAVTTADQAIRGAWARSTPVRVLVAHTRAPATRLLVSARHRGEVIDVADLRGKRVGIPGPGTTAHLVLETLLRARKLEPWQVGVQSLGSTALLSRLGSGELDAAMVDEPTASRALALGVAGVILDLRQPDEAAKHLGGPFYEVVSVTPADEKKLAERERALAAYARAVVRVQAWLATAPADAVADRLPPALVRDRERFRVRLLALQPAYAPDGAATEAGLAATLRVLRAGSPWPVGVEVTAEALREPAFVTEARKALGPTPAPP